MGVTIEAYSRLDITEPHEFDPDQCYDVDHIQAFVLGGFEHSRRGLVAGRCYAPTLDSESHRIGDWPYMGYGRWREVLCRAVNGYAPEQVWPDPGRYRNDPLFELVHFADNEGTIGPDAAADLLQDFTRHASKLDHLWAYDDWLKGLRLAADGGLIQYR